MRTHLVLILILLGSVPAAVVPVHDASGAATVTNEAATVGDASAVGSASEVGDAVTAQTEPADPESDVLGWENGVWHDESIAIDRSDGLNDTELDRIVDRTMARVERVRELEFEDDVPVSVLSREEFRNQRPGGEVPDALREFDNVKFEALLMINESTDSIAVQDRNAGSSILGFYDPRSDEIVLISEGGPEEGVSTIDEITLAHELLHALQDQKWDLTSYERRSREDANTIDGLLEGDPEFLEVLYRQECTATWGDCLIPDQQAGGGGSLANVGPFILKFQPRSDGPELVQQVRREGGWEAVNDLYDDPPASTEQFIHLSKFPGDEPTRVRVEDRTTDEWERIRVPGQPDSAVLGEAGFFSMFLFPSFERPGTAPLVSIDSFQNTTADGSLQPIGGLNYSHPLSAGWDGDRLVPYVSDETAENETAYVWKSVWDSEADAAEFAAGYRELLQFRGAEQVESRENTFRIPESEEFADAFYVEQRGDTVVVVNAPTVSALSEVRDGAAPETN